MTQQYNTSLEMSYDDDNQINDQSNSLLNQISMDEDFLEGYEKIKETINEHRKIGIESEEEKEEILSENDINDINSLLEASKISKKDSTNDYSLIISLLNYISRNVMKMKQKFQNISAVKTMFNFMFAELEENKNDKIKDMLFKLFNFLFCENELNFTNEMNFLKKFQEIKNIKLKQIRDIILEIREEIALNNAHFNHIRNELRKKEAENNALALKNEMMSKECIKIATVEEKCNNFVSFINELNSFLNISQNSFDLFNLFDKIKEKFVKLKEENDALKKNDKFEAFKVNSLNTIKKLEEENLRKSEEISKLKEKNGFYKNLLRKLKGSLIELNESNENKEQLIKKQADVIDFFKKNSYVDNLSTNQLKTKIEKLKNKIIDESNEALKIIMMNDLKDYEKMYFDLIQLKK
ncbi:hypothetical protein H312_01898 [Anncaliia algerae PRA339]|uniref:Uncharacterized protein n=1 Tax=Anncaliia algerae PRA339 TaxID=1288291 RepID=A0A059F0K2_9MICR|nr:hypothetical protein H312_01898 [Anncaliia algerae PRA339]